MESRLRSDESTLRDRVLAYLRHHNTLTLATWWPDGPWAAALFYVNDGFDLFWLSDPAARHSRNIAQSPRVAVAIREGSRPRTRLPVHAGARPLHRQRARPGPEGRGPSRAGIAPHEEGEGRYRFAAPTGPCVRERSLPAS